MSEEWISGHGPGVDLWPSVSRTPSQLYPVTSARMRQEWQSILVHVLFDFLKRVIPALIWGSEVTQQAGLLTLSSVPSRWQFLPACWLLSSQRGHGPEHAGLQGCSSDAALLHFGCILLPCGCLWSLAAMTGKQVIHGKMFNRLLWRKYEEV